VRYGDAVSRATVRGAGSTLTAFEAALRTTSAAVINCNLSFLKDFVTRSNSLYSTYHLSVQAQMRKPASMQHDQERAVVDAIMFRGFAPSIRFAALSLNNMGPISYGPYAITLKEIAVSHRSSLLEENSYKFVEHHGLGSKTLVPAGYRGSWSERTQLAVAKLGDRIDVGPQVGGFAKLLLTSNGNYDDDDFIEVHIFGPFDFGAVEQVTGPVPKKGPERAIWSVVKDAVIKAGKKVNEL
jgi:hypothetical protein